jgi:hypothetical protein
VPKPKIKSWSVAAQKIADQATDPFAFRSCRSSHLRTNSASGYGITSVTGSRFVYL